MLAKVDGLTGSKLSRSAFIEGVHPSWIMCDNLVSLRKSDLIHYVGALPRAKLPDLNRALKMALDSL